MPKLDFLNPNYFSYEDKRKLSRLVKAIGRPVGLMTLVLGINSLAGYFLSMEELYRPIANGPATHPLTATVIVLISVCIVFAHYGVRHFLSSLVSFIAVLLCLLHISDLLVGTSFTAHITPFSDVVENEIRLGKQNAMGMNTVFMLLLLALSSLFYLLTWPLLSQFMAFVALAFPTVSLTGYAYGMTLFYGEMSLLSATFGGFLCVACLAITADRGAMKALLSPHIGGRIARVQVVLGYLVPLIVGYLVVRSIVHSSQTSMFGVYVVAICWFIILLVVISAIVQEKADLKRREAELALRRSAYIDELTKLPNRRYFMEEVTDKLSETHEKNQSPWAFMIDIDHFKKINDTAGHAMGDKVLIGIANALKKTVKRPNLASRLGGEEFCVYLCEADKETAKQEAETIRLAIEEAIIEDYTHQYGPVTASIGCAAAKANDVIDQVLHLADEALYASKHNGRNCVSFA